MPPTGLSASILRTLSDVVASVGVYSIDAYYFIQEGINHADERVHGPQTPGTQALHASRHVSGQELCLSLRDIAVARWGLMARTVLGTWGISSTADFGRIVFAMIEVGLFKKQPDDSIDDFVNVYDFRRAFDVDYKIALPAKIG